eukprot:gene28514-biopygen32440
MDHILRNCTSTLAAKLDAYTNNAAKALRYIRLNCWGQASAQDAALPPSTPVHQPPSSPSDDGDSTAPPTPTSDGEPSDLRAFEDAAAAADLLRGAIPMLSGWGINYEVSDPVPPEPRLENPLQGPAQTVEAMVIMSQDVQTPAKPPPNWSLHPKILEMTLEMATSPKLLYFRV